MQPTIRPDGAQAGSVDFYALFDSKAPWPVAAAHVSVFKIYAAVLRDASDEQIRSLVAGLAERHIALALEAPVLVEPARCDSPNSPESPVVGLVAHLKALGGDLSALAMAGPVVDGHTSPDPNACHRTLKQVAAEAARVVGAIRRYYPHISVGEIEPVGQGPGQPDWQELNVWFDAWRSASGAPLAFLHMDTLWGAPWHEEMRVVAQRTRAAGIRFGVIYKGEPSDLSDAAFTSDALERADEVEAVLNGTPDDVILQSWENYPRHALPDTDASTMTGLVRAYVRPKTRLGRTQANHIALIREDKTAIAGAQLLVETHDPRPGQSLQLLSLAGTTPHTAHSALVGLRVHAECDCPRRPSDVLITGYQFQTSNAGNDYHGYLGAWVAPPTAMLTALKPDYAPALKLHAQADQPVILNGPTFALEPDQPFTLTVSAQVEPQSDGTGFVVIVFKGANDSEVQRTFFWLKTTWRQVSMLSTGLDGGAVLPPLPTSPGDVIRVRFLGNLDNRPSVLELR